ncbi:hypothetical protein LXL04_034317 [Taraxacum kok-saghyz]
MSQKMPLSTATLESQGAFDSKGTTDKEYAFVTDLKDENFPNEKIPLDKINGDEFLNLHWKRQVPIIRMRFLSPKQLKNMPHNYVMENGYRLCLKKNERKRLLVVCCKGGCTLRLWGDMDDVGALISNEVIRE